MATSTTKSPASSSRGPTGGHNQTPPPGAHPPTAHAPHAHRHLLPIAALKRFAEDVKEHDPHFVQLNHQRVQQFIDKPFQLTSAYEYQQRKTSPKRNLAPFDRSLGIRSRFGDGDGSFFDRWLNSDVLSSHRVLDADGLPIMSFPVNLNRTGFKKHLQDYKESKVNDGPPRRYVTPYAKRREAAENLLREREAAASGSATDAAAAPAAKIDIKDTLKLPPLAQDLSVAEQQNYFGFEARSSFFDHYKELTRHIKSERPQNRITTTSNVPTKEAHSKLSMGTTEHETIATRRTPTFATKRRGASPPAEKPTAVFAKGTPELQAIFDNILAVDDDHKITSTRRPSSARTKFLKACVEKGALPRAGLIVRRDMTEVLNLTAYGIGNQLANILADALDALPLLEGLLLAENNLTDAGLVPLLKKLALCRQLRILDISSNKVDAQSAQALRDYLSCSECHLKVLKMQNANLDDYEAFLFMEALAVMNTIEELDLSRNLLGSSEISIKRSYDTAGESIARLLKADKCSLRTLILSWNTIRYHSSVALADSLKFNQTLTHLDVGCNGLGVAGGEALGNALHSNISLRSLIVNNNSISARPCFTIFSGIKTCKSLELVDLSGNPIGEEGARDLLTLNITEGHRVKVEIKNCSLRFKDVSCWFNPLNPKGEYELKMQEPYERAICIEILRAIARDRNLKLLKFRCTQAEDGCAWIDANLQVYQPLVTDAQNEASQNPSTARSSASISSLPTSREAMRDLFRETAVRIFRQLDADESGALDRNELLEMLEELGFEDTWHMVDKLMSIYDADGSGVVEEEEFISFLVDIKTSYESGTDFAAHKRYVYDADRFRDVATIAPEAYFPSERGKVMIKVDGQQSLMNFANNLSLQASQVDRLVSATQNLPDTEALFDVALATNKWTLKDAQMLFQVLVKEKGAVLPTLLKLLPHMASALDARLLIAFVTKHRFEQVQHLKYLLGPLYKIYVGIPNGYYSLNLSDKSDREAFQLLVQLNKQCAEQRQASGRGDTSQDGKWSGFRNVMIDGVRSEFHEEWLQKLPEAGRVDFDFIAYKANSVKESTISNLRLFRILLELGLVEENKRKRIFAKLQQCASEGRQSAKGLGNHKFEITANAAQLIAVYLHKLYNPSKVLPAHLVALLAAFVGSTGAGLGSAMPKRAQPWERKLRPYTIDVGKEETALLVSRRKAKKLTAIKTVMNNGGQSVPGYLLSLPGSGKKGLVSLSRMNSRRRSGSRARADSVSSVGSTDSNSSMRLTPSSSAKKLHADNDLDEPKIQQPTLFDIPEFQPTVDDGEVKSIEMYGSHIKEMIADVHMDHELIAMRVLDAFETILCGRYLTCAQLGLLIDRIPHGQLHISPFSTYRVELVVSLFSNLVDVINFEYVVKELEPSEIAMLWYRLGVLNVWNPLKPEGFIWLDLSRRDERQLARILVTLKCVEVGETWLEPLFREQIDAEPVAGWTLPLTWYAEETLPSHGILSVQYFSGKGMQLNGCEPNIRCRQNLMSLVLAQPYEEDLWHASDSVIEKAEQIIERMGFRLSFMSERQTEMAKQIAASHLQTAEQTEKWQEGGDEDDDTAENQEENGRDNGDGKTE